MTEQLTKLMVNLQERSYPIYIGEHLFDQQLLPNYVLGNQVLVVTNEKIAPLYLDHVKRHFQNMQCDQIILPDGESHKTLATVNLIFDVLVQKKHLRSTTLVALGGGVVGDMTGFAAACYQRGVNFIQIPTTLLSQVDASVGGKTAVNHPLAKNMIGAFYQPKAVFIDVATLQTLDDREFRCGLAEIIKAALICDLEFFIWLEENLSKLLAREVPAITHAIKQACAIKIKIVTEDEREANIRALLNLGHTFGHALEQLTGYGVWLHGEAVAIGLVLAAEYSARIGWLDNESVARIKNLLTKAQLPIRLPNSIDAKDLLEGMESDKKKDTEGLKLVLLKGIGQAVLSQKVDPEILAETILENQGKSV